MAGISSRALKLNYSENKYKFNDATELENKEFDDGNGLDWYTTDFRSYDPQIGRFLQVDELADMVEDWSPYVYAFDSPILLNDPLGLSADTAVPGVPEMQPVVVTPGNNSPSNIPQVVSNTANEPAPDPSAAEPNLAEFILTRESFVGGTGEKPDARRVDFLSELLFLTSPEGRIWYTIVERPGFWEGFFSDFGYQGKNLFGVKIYTPYYGGTPPDAGLSGFGIIGKIRKIGTLFKHGFNLEGQLAKIWSNRRLFLNWLKNNHSLTRVTSPLNAAEAQLVIDNAKRLGIPLEFNLKGLQGLEVTGQWGGVPHFKVGHVHIPIENGLENILTF